MSNTSMHVFLYSSDYVVALDAGDAAMVLAGEDPTVDLCLAADGMRQLPDDQPLTVSTEEDDGTVSRETRTCREWAEGGRRWIAGDPT